MGLEELSKKIEDTIKVNIGGERLYIIPYSYYEYPRNGENKIIYNDYGEYSPKGEGVLHFGFNLDAPGNLNFSPLKQFYYLFVKRFLIAVWKTFLFYIQSLGTTIDIYRRFPKRRKGILRNCKHYFLPSVTIFYYYYGVCTPIIGVEFYPRRSIHGGVNIQVEQERDNISYNYIDEYYLTPRDYLVKTMINELFAHPEDKYDRLERKMFIKWANSQIKLGRKIGYLTSLDT